ncbi:hypothetical protein LXL04_026456 [Taraxacum kok-saghyz]
MEKISNYGVFLILILLLVPFEWLVECVDEEERGGKMMMMMMMVAEGKFCEIVIDIYDGRCYSNNMCNTLCKHEGYISGRCHDRRPLCYCTKYC